MITIKLTEEEARLVAGNVDGWLDAGACKGGMEDDERAALHKLYDQCMGVVGRKRKSAARPTVAADAAAPSAKWSKEPPTEQGLYWHWTGDLDACPIPLTVLWSGTTRKCFVSIGQYGITQAIDCDEYGGYWQPAIEPEMDEEIGFHGSDA